MADKIPWYRSRTQSQISGMEAARFTREVNAGIFESDATGAPIGKSIRDSTGVVKRRPFAPAGGGPAPSGPGIPTPSGPGIPSPRGGGGGGSFGGGERDNRKPDKFGKKRVTRYEPTRYEEDIDPSGFSQESQDREVRRRELQPARDASRAIDTSDYLTSILDAAKLEEVGDVEAANERYAIAANRYAVPTELVAAMVRINDTPSDETLDDADVSYAETFSQDIRNRATTAAEGLSMISPENVRASARGVDTANRSLYGGKGAGDPSSVAVDVGFAAGAGALSGAEYLLEALQKGIFTGVNSLETLGSAAGRELGSRTARQATTPIGATAPRPGETLIDDAPSPLDAAKIPFDIAKAVFDPNRVPGDTLPGIRAIENERAQDIASLTAEIIFDPTDVFLGGWIVTDAGRVLLRGARAVDTKGAVLLGLNQNSLERMAPDLMRRMQQSADEGLGMTMREATTLKYEPAARGLMSAAPPPAASRGEFYGRAIPAAENRQRKALLKELPIGGSGEVPRARGIPAGQPDAQLFGVNALAPTDVDILPGGQVRPRVGGGAGPSNGDMSYATHPELPAPVDFQYRVMELDDLIPSQTDAFVDNDAYPRQLQPRTRDSLASELQVKGFAANLKADELTHAFPTFDRGIPIIGDDLVVESGNGRVLGIRRAREMHPDQYANYQKALRETAEEFGIPVDELDGFAHPVLVRERTTAMNMVERTDFVRVANLENGMAMNAIELAKIDGSTLTPQMMQQFHPLEGTATMRDHLENSMDFVRAFVRELPQNSLNKMMDDSGRLSNEGVARIENAMFQAAFPSAAGARMMKRLVQSPVPQAKSVQDALVRALPELSELEALVASGARGAEWSIGEDIAVAADRLIRLRQIKMTVEDYLRTFQATTVRLGEEAVAGQREMTPFQEGLLAVMDANVRSSVALSDVFRTYARNVRDGVAAPSQGGLFGAASELAAPSTKEEVFSNALNTVSETKGRTIRGLTEGVQDALLANAQPSRVLEGEQGVRGATPGGAATPDEIIPPGQRAGAGRSPVDAEPAAAPARGSRTDVTINGETETLVRGVDPTAPAARTADDVARETSERIEATARAESGIDQGEGFTPFWQHRKLDVIDATTGEPAKIRVFHGSGRSDKGAAYALGDEGIPVLGEGRYSALDEPTAAYYGPNVVEHVLELENPLVIDGIEQLRELAPLRGGEAALFTNGPERIQWFKDIGEVIARSDYDAVIVNVPNAAFGEIGRISQSSTKRLREIFGQSTVFQPQRVLDDVPVAAVDDVAPVADEFVGMTDRQVVDAVTSLERQAEQAGELLGGEGSRLDALNLELEKRGLIDVETGEIADLGPRPRRERPARGARTDVTVNGKTESQVLGTDPTRAAAESAPPSSFTPEVKPEVTAARKNDTILPDEVKDAYVPEPGLDDLPPEKIAPTGQARQGVEVPPIENRNAAEILDPPTAHAVRMRNDPDYLARFDTPEDLRAARELMAEARKTNQQLPLDDIAGAGGAGRGDGIATGAAGPGGRKPLTVAQSLAYVRQRALEGERRIQTLTRVVGGSAARQEHEIKLIVGDGGEAMVATGHMKWVNGHYAVIPEKLDEVKDLFRALHQPSKVADGSIVVPKALEAEYTRLRELTDWEQMARIDFDPSQALINDYFYRGSRVPDRYVDKGTGVVNFGSHPSFRKLRENITFDDQLELGIEPLSWNPFEQWAISAMQGVRHRTQLEFLEHLRNLNITRPSKTLDTIQGWRVPQIGPAFQGKPFSVEVRDASGVLTGEPPKTMFRDRWMVPNEVAKRLEAVYGAGLDMGKLNIGSKEFDPKAIIDKMVFLPKRAKLLGSFFQQADFTRRNLAGSWGRLQFETGQAAGALRRGHPLESFRHVTQGAGAMAHIPGNVRDIIRAYFSPSARLNLAKERVSTKSLVEGRSGVHNKGLTEAGLTTVDFTLFDKNTSDLVGMLAKDNGVSVGVIRRNLRRLGDLEGMMQRGLFEGVYDAAIMTDIKHNIAPMMAKWAEDTLGPKVTDEVINGLIATFANLKYSTLPPSQSVIQNKFMRNFLTRAMFSSNEAESLLRQGFGTIKGISGRGVEGGENFRPGIVNVGGQAMEKAMRNNTWGLILGLAATANVVNKVTTGDWLPMDRLSPIAFGTQDPLGVGYNRDFMAPTIPVEGRGGVQMTWDLVGQMDTIFRLFDPVSFMTSRESVPLRAFRDQFTNKDFYGREITDGGPDEIVERTRHLLAQLFTPISVTAFAEAARQGVPALTNLIENAPVETGETRVGVLGNLIQGIGENVRAETNAQVRDRIAREEGFTNRTAMTDQEFDSALETRPGLAEEIDRRSVESDEQGQASAQAREERKEINQDRIAQEQAAWERLTSPNTDDPIDVQRFNEIYSDIQLRAATAKAQVNEDYGLFQETGELPSEPGPRAVTLWFDGRTRFERADGTYDYLGFEEWEANFLKGLSSRQREFVDEIRETEHAAELDTWQAARDVVGDSGYWNVADDFVMADTVEKFPNRDVPATYNELTEAALIAERREDQGRADELNLIISSVDRQVRELRKQLRLDDAFLDAALGEAYGLNPVEASSGGGTRARINFSSGSGGRGGSRISPRGGSRIAPR